jgi:hypothetical protein
MSPSQGVLLVGGGPQGRMGGAQSALPPPSTLATTTPRRIPARARPPCRKPWGPRRKPCARWWLPRPRRSTTAWSWWGRSPPRSKLRERRSHSFPSAASTQINGMVTGSRPQSLEFKTVGWVLGDYTWICTQHQDCRKMVRRSESDGVFKVVRVRVRARERVRARARARVMASTRWLDIGVNRAPWPRARKCRREEGRHSSFVG